MPRFPSSIRRCHATRAPDPRSAFTLVELLVTMTVIAILASMALFALFGAQESARRAKTQSTISKLHSIVMTLYDSYKTRRVPIVTTGMTPAAAAKARLDGLRELMRLEMPDRWTDINDNPVTKIYPNDSSTTTLMARPAVSQAYLRLAPTAKTTSSPNAGAKCLYMIVTTLGEDNREMFSDNEIGEPDLDGFKTFIDGWGKPIAFLRWAPGFVSELQSQDPVKNHDQFDTQKVYANAYALTPLIYSPGPDGILDIKVDSSSGALRYSQVTNNPFADVSIGTEMVILGTNELSRTTLGSKDNIHNHFIGLR